MTNALGDVLATFTNSCTRGDLVHRKALLYYSTGYFVCFAILGGSSKKNRECQEALAWGRQAHLQVYPFGFLIPT